MRQCKRMKCGLVMQHCNFKQAQVLVVMFYCCWKWHQVQEAMLTGESVPVSKNLKPVAEAAPLGDRKCMAFSATSVSSGNAKAVVVATGDRAEIGKINKLVGEVRPCHGTPLLCLLLGQQQPFAPLTCVHKKTSCHDYDQDSSWVVCCVCQPMYSDTDGNEMLHMLSDHTNAYLSLGY